MSNEPAAHCCGQDPRTSHSNECPADGHREAAAPMPPEPQVDMVQAIGNMGNRYPMVSAGAYCALRIWAQERDEAAKKAEERAEKAEAERKLDAEKYASDKDAWERLQNSFFGTETGSYEEYAKRELACWALIDEVRAYRRGVYISHLIDPIEILTDEHSGLLSRETHEHNLKMIRASRIRSQKTCKHEFVYWNTNNDKCKHCELSRTDFDAEHLGGGE